MRGIGRASRPGQIGAARLAIEHGFALVARDLLHGKRYRGIDDIDDHVDLLGVEPFVRDRGTDIGLVLMIGIDDLDRHIADLAAEILDRELHRADRMHAVVEAILAREIVEHADLDLVVGELRRRLLRRDEFLARTRNAAAAAALQNAKPMRHLP